MTLLTPEAGWGDVFDAAYTAPDVARKVGAPAPEKWAPWLAALFPGHVRAGFAERHVIYWRHVWAITPDASPDPFAGIWPRGGGKTTSGELGACALGTRGMRKYGLYVRGTQERADDSVSNIAALLESEGVARHYPSHAERRLGKHGNSKGWRRNRVWTGGGFVMDAIGLDVAARGVKLEDQRPDFIVLDDLDEKHDSAATTEKKIQTITTSLLPAGASNVAVFGLQNLIIPDGIFARLADGRADFLARRVVSGPHPAVDGLVTASHEDPATGITRHVIVAGTATWGGQSLAVCQKQIDEWGVDAFRKESQHEVTRGGAGLAVPVTAAETEALTDAQVRTLVGYGQAFAGIDFGHWRFACVVCAADPAGVVHVVHEVFDQRGDATTRARALHAVAERYGLLERLARGLPFPIWGDAANPSDIKELNAAFRRLESPLVCVAVGMANKQRAASVERINDARGRGALRFRAALGQDLEGQPQRWHIGLSAGSAGVETRGSRLRWELTQWRYPVPKPGEPQDESPDDDTADGADAIAALRYAVMSHWQPGTAPAVRTRQSEHQHPGLGRTARPDDRAPSAPPVAMPAPWPAVASDDRTTRVHDLTPDGYREIP